MAQVLHQIDVAWFDASWLNRIKEDVGDNWRIKSSNLKKILQGIMDYYHEVWNSDCSNQSIYFSLSLRAFFFLFQLG
ncbi:protein Hook homolog 1-like [Meleagris gallopavo]|uniref:protein Hook homolog 1-like n=1 Tax=Meleagris gallopavo TaxID=9103 RepID=UPI000549E158|nr:protein Hook homolog 1-like [Meleagris gallopavo]